MPGLLFLIFHSRPRLHGDTPALMFLPLCRLKSSLTKANHFEIMACNPSTAVINTGVIIMSTLQSARQGKAPCQRPSISGQFPFLPPGGGDALQRPQKPFRSQASPVAQGWDQPSSQDLVEQRRIGISQEREEAGERGGWEKERGGKYVIPDHPRDSWLLKHREILTAGWIEGAGATHDSERFIPAEPRTEAFIKGRQGEPSSTSRQFKGAILFPSSVPGRTPTSIF